MPTISTITLNDGQAVPVARDFVPRSRDIGRSTYAELDTAETKIGEPSIVLDFKPATGTSKVTRASIRLNLPLELGNASDGYTVEDVGRVQVNFQIPSSFPTQHKADLYAYAVNLLAHSVVQGMVEDGEPVY